MMKVPLPRPRALRSHSGFTMIELLIVIAILGVLSLVGLPNLLAQIERARISSTLREATSLVQVARQEAIRRGVEVVVLVDTTNNRLQAFANVDGDAGLLYQPSATAVPRTADYEVMTTDLRQTGNQSTSIHFWGPADASPNGTDIVDGLSTDGNSDPIAIFDPDGTIREEGAFRIADARGNFFEVRIAPRATARVEVRKWYPSPPFGGGSDFFPKGKASSGDNLWKWY